VLVVGDRPVGGRDYPRTYQEFRSWFPTEWRCREYLAELRWPHGFSCPSCGSGGYWRTGTGLWMCADCGLKTSATAGTIFHRSHTALSTWFAAIWFVTSQKNGVSARGLQDALGFGSYETAWAWLHKLRRAYGATGTRAAQRRGGTRPELPRRPQSRQARRTRQPRRRRSRSQSSGCPVAVWAEPGLL
jgi:ribosomal protein L37AE/L43A